MRTGIATFPLDYGRCPRWLFERMKRLSRAITIAIVEEFGPEEFLKRLSDPIWFQSFGCVLAFDWNSSGLTTTTLGAIKSSLFLLQDELGIYVCGGKGETSRKTPKEIETYGISRGFDFAPYLVFASKMAAKVDSALLQDGFQIYHHNFLFTKSGNWTVVQQGMNPVSQTARRYHWLGGFKKDFIEEPHSGIITQEKVKPLNLTSKDSKQNREVSLEMSHGNFEPLIKDVSSLTHHLQNLSGIKSLILPGDEIIPQEPNEFRNINFNTPYIRKTLFQLTEKKPKTFENLLSQKGVGPKTIRALSLVSEIIYGAKPSYEDPARYSFAHGGKDAIPFPVDRNTYDKTISVIERGIKKSFISQREREKALKRLSNAF
ncbi:MAG: DUF763 domain-containing protein [Patescibacteria group bacterium]